MCTSHSYPCSNHEHITMNCVFLKNKFMRNFALLLKLSSFNILCDVLGELRMRAHTHTHIRDYNSHTESSYIKTTIFLLLDTDGQMQSRGGGQAAQLIHCCERAMKYFLQFFKTRGVHVIVLLVTIFGIREEITT